MDSTSRKKLFKLKSLIFVFASLFSLPIFAGTLNFDFVRTSTLTNVDDAEGRWQFSGGKVYLSGNHVGYFVSKKRVSFGASPVNRAALETTIIWKYGDHNITVQGTHYFGTGTEQGSVSATSSAFSYLKDANVSGTHQHLTFTY
jgi:hypothetical protein